MGEADPLISQIAAAGIRAAFEMEQILPGVDSDDWDTDPVADAAELHRCGMDRKAKKILRDLVALDARCIDGWVHLGNIAFDGRGPAAAREFYDRLSRSARVRFQKASGACSLGAWSITDRFTVRCTASGSAPGGNVDGRRLSRSSPAGSGSKATPPRRHSGAATRCGSAGDGPG